MAQTYQTHPDALSKGDIRRQRQAEHVARETARLAAGDTRTCHERKINTTPRQRRVKLVRERGYLGTRESIDAYLSGAPMSSDDY